MSFNNDITEKLLINSSELSTDIDDTQVKEIIEIEDRVLQERFDKLKQEREKPNKKLKILKDDEVIITKERNFCFYVKFMFKMIKESNARLKIELCLSIFLTILSTVI